LDGKNYADLRTWFKIVNLSFNSEDNRQWFQEITINISNESECRSIKRLGQDSFISEIAVFELCAKPSVTDKEADR